MAVFRVIKNENYTTVSNYHLKDKRLSLKAKGLLTMMLSLKEDWNYSIAGLAAISKENETAIKSGLNELKEYGYLEVIKKNPNETDNGRYGYIYNIYEEPQEYEKQALEKQGVEILGVEFQGVENLPQLNTKDKATEKSKNEKSITENKREGRFTPPTLHDVEEYAKEKGYDLDCEYFWDYWESVGWKRGKGTMKDWKATLRNWVSRDNSKPKKKKSGFNPLGESMREYMDRCEKIPIEEIF